MLVAAALAVVILFIGTGLAWTARLVHVGNCPAIPGRPAGTSAPEPTREAALATTGLAC